MSTTWPDADWQYARKLGCQLFRKPFELKEMLEWLNDCEKRLIPQESCLIGIEIKKLIDMLK